MSKISQPARAKPAISHTAKPSRLPLNRLLEAKVLNSARGELLRNALFPLRRAN
jgi:hypothetical protein